MISSTLPAEKAQSKFLRVLAKETVFPPPLWMMRQAGRYLPEYRALRQTAGSFLDLCYTPALAAEVTLQPIRRFGFDAAILFSDILVVPHALGQHVDFIEGKGPSLEPLQTEDSLSELKETIDLEALSPVFETIERVCSALPAQTPLIGFCGAPWTVASYMIAGKSTPDQAPARRLAYENPVFLQRLIDRLVEASTAYLVRQIEAGVHAIQIFESFGGALPPALFKTWSYDPICRIVEGVRAFYPHIPVIVFPRGAGSNMTLFLPDQEQESVPGERLVNANGLCIDALGLDWTVETEWASRHIQPYLPVQGNLDPIALLAGGQALEDAIDRIETAFRSRPHIFNLGHGILPETPIAHVEHLVKRVRNS